MEMQAGEETDIEINRQGAKRQCVGDTSRETQRQMGRSSRKGLRGVSKRYTAFCPDSVAEPENRKCL